MGGRILLRITISRKETFLVFQYNGESCFDVLMFEKSGCEKAGSYFVDNKKLTRQELMEEDSVEFGDVPPHREAIDCSSSSYSDSHMPQASTANEAKRVPSSSFKSLPSKRARGRPPRKVSGSSKHTAYPVKKEGDEMHEHEKNASAHAAIFMSKRMNLSDAKKEWVWQLLREVRPRNPVFVSIMRPTYLHRRAYLTISSDFAAAHLPNRTKTIYLQTPGRKKKWPVIYLVQKKVTDKWTIFVIDNKLEEGDLCIFELADGQKDILMTVHIFVHQERSSY